MGWAAHSPGVLATTTTCTQGGGGGGGGDKRMRFGSAPANPAPFVTLQSLRKGRALLATCEVGRERQAGKELRVILERFVEHDKGKGGKAGGEAAAAGGGSVREALQQEMEELRKAKGTGSAILPVDTVSFRKEHVETDELQRPRRVQPLYDTYITCRGARVPPG